MKLSKQKFYVVYENFLNPKIMSKFDYPFKEN